ncbi:hypothetical protein K0018_01080 [Staphylococcus massiliensis]|uniref:DUF6583 family protein n=1 Tax=Staphylococcus massiliensis TaxID=555791 RepID=UPI001EDF8786|nr:DUF6583 family protein [Staphylococcus massiliensis]MCG3411689.1 hypothetical protein [Staphylococcus massiliensis]
MSKKAKIIIGVVLALLLVVGGGSLFAFFSKVNSPKNSYLLIEQKTMEKFNDYLEKRYDNEFKFMEEMNDNSYQSKTSFSLDLSDDVIDSLELSKSVVDATKLETVVAHDSKDKKSQIALTPTVADSKVGTFEWDADADNQYFKSPLFDDIFKVPNDKIKDTYEELLGESIDETQAGELNNDSLNLNTILGQTVSREDVKKVDKKYQEKLINKLDDDNFSKEKEKVDIFGEEKELDKLTMKLSNKEVKETIVYVLEEAKKDKELKEVLANAQNDKDFDKSLKDMIKEAKDKKASEYPKVNSVIYVEDEQVVKRDLKLTQDDTTLRLHGTSKIEDDKLRVDYKFGDETKYNDGTFEIEIKGESKGKPSETVKDDYTIRVDGSDIESKLEFKNENSHDGDKTSDEGTVKVSVDLDQFVLDFKSERQTDLKNNSMKTNSNFSSDMDGSQVGVNVKDETKLKEKVKFDTKGAKNLNGISESEKEDILSEIEENFTKIAGDIIEKAEDK